MDECGDSAWNTTFELCEFTLNPPIPVSDSADPTTFYDPNNAGSHYPEHDAAAEPANSTVVWVTGHKHDEYSPSCAASDVWVGDTCVGYFTCNEKCRLVQYDGCGDGVPSNGPPPDD